MPDCDSYNFVLKPFLRAHLNNYQQIHKLGTCDIDTISFTIIAASGGRYTTARIKSSSS